MAAFDEKEYTQAFDWSIWKRLLPILGRFKGRYIKLIGFTAIADLTDSIQPLFQLYAISHFIQAGTLDGLIPFAAAYLLCIAVLSLMVVASTDRKSVV